MTEDVREATRAAPSDAAASTPGGVVGPGTEADQAASIPAPRPRRRQWLVLLVGLVFLFTPAAAHVSGVRATEIENRRLTDFPPVSAGWDFFPQLSAWATDHLPLRDRAVAANARLSETVFGEPPQYGGLVEDDAVPVAPVAPEPEARPVVERVFPAVLQGEDGWLFFGEDVEGPCEPRRPLEETLAGLSRFGEIVEASGRTHVFTVAPDKSWAAPDRLPDVYVGDDCAFDVKADLWDRLRARPPSGYVDLERALARVQQREGESLWRPSDSHWTPRGALVYVEQVARALDPALWRTSRLVPTGPERLSGDLAVLLGSPRRDEVPGWRLERPGVVVEESTPTALSSTTTGAPLWPGKTLVIGDSFTQASRDALATLFSSARIVHPDAAEDAPEDLVAAVREADTVVLELVERVVEGGRVDVGDPAFLRRLEQALAADGPAGGSD